MDFFRDATRRMSWIWLGVLTGVSPSRPRNSENLKIWDSAPRAACSRSARSGPVFAGMGVGKPEAKRLENLRIWEPGAANRAGAKRAARQIPGAGEGKGGRISGFQIFRKRCMDSTNPLT
jgi:hypothetical protein